MNRLQHFFDLAAAAPRENDPRYFRAWQRVSVRVQREIRALVSRTFFAEEARAALDPDRAFTIVVYCSCQPSFGRRPGDFTYDACELASLAPALRLIGRSMRARLARISAGFEDPRLKRRFLPVWHEDILNVVRRKPQKLIKLLAREAAAIDALIAMPAVGDALAVRRFEKRVASAARVFGIDSAVLQDLMLRAGAENLVDGRIDQDRDAIAPGSPDCRIGGNEDRDDRSPDGGGQMTDAGVVSDVQPCL